MDRIITLDGKDFLICQELDVDGKHYIYAVSIDDDEYTVLLEYEKDGEMMVRSLTDDDEIKYILNIIAKENI